MDGSGLKGHGVDNFLVGLLTFWGPDKSCVLFCQVSQWLSKLCVATCCVEHESCIELAGLKEAFDIIVVLWSTSCFLDGLDFS